MDKKNNNLTLSELADAYLNPKQPSEPHVCKHSIAVTQSNCDPYSKCATLQSAAFLLS